MDCELNGKCVNSVCQCNPGWKGESCSSLNLTTAPYPNQGIWPLPPSHDAETCYSWGFTVIKSITDNQYHGYANAGCYNISNDAQKQVNGSFLMHVTSSSPIGTTSISLHSQSPNTMQTILTQQTKRTIQSIRYNNADHIIQSSHNLQQINEKICIILQNQ